MSATVSAVPQDAQAQLSELIALLKERPVSPVKAWVSDLKWGISTITAVGVIVWFVFASGQKWSETGHSISVLNNRITQVSTDVSAKIGQVESDVRSRLEAARMQTEQADSILRQQQTAAAEQIRMLHQTAQAANERMSQISQTLATISAQNANLAERMAELGRRQDRLEARLGLSRGPPIHPPGGASGL